MASGSMSRAESSGDVSRSSLAAADSTMAALSGSDDTSNVADFRRPAFGLTSGLFQERRKPDYLAHLAGAESRLWL